MPSLTVTVCRRPEYTLHTLSLLKSCDGVRDWDISIFVDNQCDVTRDLVKNISPSSWGMHISDGPLGCNENVRRAFRHGFEASDFHVHLEDDTSPARDALSFYKWASQFGGDPELFCVCGYSRRGGEPHLAVKSADYTAWGFATWRDRWLEMDADWSPVKEVSWDTWMDRNVRKGRLAISPLASRIQNIGRFGGTYNNPYVWEHEQFTREMVSPEVSIDESSWRLNA
jgi:hypothetical protein